MSMVFKFRMLSDENENFVRDYEVLYDMTLLDFHDFICNELEYDIDNFCSFFSSNEQWEKLQEYTLVDMGDDDGGIIAIEMKDVILGQIIRQKRDRLIFMFDIFADRSYFLELSEAKEVEEGVSYPQVVLAEGDPVDQFDAESLIDEDTPFNEIMSEFIDFEGADDDYLSDDF